MLLDLSLPAELVLDVMDLAEYHPAISIKRETYLYLNACRSTRRTEAPLLLSTVLHQSPSPRLEGGRELASMKGTVNAKKSKFATVKLTDEVDGETRVMLVADEPFYLRWRYRSQPTHDLLLRQGFHAS